MGCDSLEYIPDDIYSNVKGTDLVFISCSNSFRDCHKLNNVPKHYLNDIGRWGKIRDVDYLFWNCYNIKEVPQGFFDSLYGCTYFQNAF